VVKWAGPKGEYESGPLGGWVERWRDWGLFAWRRVKAKVLSILGRGGSGG